jgi:hypothetical protein
VVVLLPEQCIGTRQQTSEEEEECIPYRWQRACFLRTNRGVSHDTAHAIRSDHAPQTPPSPKLCYEPHPYSPTTPSLREHACYAPPPIAQVLYEQTN